MKPKQTRNRITKPAWTFSGINALVWRTEPAFIAWAQTSPEFRNILTVLTNERERALTGVTSPAFTENRLLGRVEGYETALAVLRSLAEGATPEAKSDNEPTYAPELETAANWQD